MYVIVPTDSKTPKHVFVVPASQCESLPESFDIHLVKAEQLAKGIKRQLSFSKELPGQGQGIQVPCQVRKRGEEIYFSSTSPQRLVSMRFSLPQLKELLSSFSG